MLEVLLDSLLDSLKVLAVVFAICVLLSFFEDKLSLLLSKGHKMSPLFGAMFGLIPQCGISVVAGDMYLKKHITVGTLIAVFLACSDEALPILLASGNQKALSVIPLILVKFVVGFAAGFVIDLILRPKKAVAEHLEQCEHVEEVHVGCCHHEIDAKAENKWEKHLLHPILHSLKLFAYVFVITFLFGTIIYFVTEERLISFLQLNKYVSPLLATLIGLIPNCASSVILSEMYLLDGISFGACLSGLCVNSGLGMIFLFKKKSGLKSNLLILSTLLGVSVVTGYICCLIVGF